MLIAMLVMLQAGAMEQAVGAVPALGTVKVQVGEALKVAVSEMAEPSEGITTPIKVCEVPTNRAALKEAVPSPERLSVPVAGGFAKTTVTLAVNRSSPGSGVPLLSQAEILLTVMSEILQGGVTEHSAGAVPAFVFDKVQVGKALKVAVNEIAEPSALIVTPVKVCGEDRPDALIEAVASPVRLSVPVLGL